MMKLLTDKQRARTPALYSQEKHADPVCGIKFFTPDSFWSWYVIEGEAIDGQPEDFRFFGYVVGMESELGYFTLAELEKARGPLGLAIERDLHFQPARLSQIKAQHEQRISA